MTHYEIYGENTVYYIYDGMYGSMEFIKNSDEIFSFEYFYKKQIKKKKKFIEVLENEN